MRKFFPFTRRKGSADTRIKGAGGGGDDGGGSRSGRHDVNRHSIGSYSSVSNRSMVIQLIRGAYNIDLAKVDQSFTKLHKSCFLNQDLNKIRKYLKQGANPNQLDNVSRSSPLHLATVNGNLNIIRLLIENGGNIDLTDGDGKTLAIKAVECFHKDCLQFLILQGANLNLSDNLTGNTVLHWSIVNNFTDGLRLCLAYAGRVDVNRKNKSGESALHLLVKYPDLHEYIGDLLDKGAEIDLRNNLQQTPLMMTCEYGYLEAARMLINRGSYIYHQDESGFTALGIAKRNGHLALSKYLTDLGGVDQLTRPESEVTPNETKTTAIDSWPSTEEEDEDEIISKTRKFDPIIQQLKSLQGGGGGLIVTSGNKKSDKVLQSSESNQQQKENNQQSTDQLKSSLDQQSNYEMNNRKGQSTGSNTSKDNDDKMTRDKLNNSMKIVKGDNLVASENVSSMKIVNSKESVPSDLTSFDHIDSVYSHETSNDEFIREIKNLLDEEIRENDELDALLFSVNFNGHNDLPTTSLVDKIEKDEDHQQDNHQFTGKIVHKSDSIEQSSAFRKLSSSSSSLSLTDHQPATSAIIVSSKSSKLLPTTTTTTPTPNDQVKLGPSKSKNMIHVDILSDLWEDWEESRNDDENGKKIVASSSPSTAFNQLTKDFSSSLPDSTVNPTVKPTTSIESNGQEILGTFFLNNISDDDDESDDDDGKSIDEIERDVKKMKDKESRGGKMDDGDEDNDRNSEYKRKEREVKKDLKSSEVEKKKNPLVKEEKTFSSSSSTHQPEHGTFSFSLTPIREEAISSSTSSSLSPSMDKKSNVPTNLMTSQSSSPPLPPPPPVNFSPPSSSPPLLPPPPPPPPPPSISFTSSSLSSLSSFPPPALPPRPSTSKLTIDTLRGKDKSIELQRSSIEVQTELDELSPRFTELEHLRIESEKRVKSLEIELSKQSREADERRNQLIEEINCMERERKLLESRLEEMKESREKLIVEKKVLILNEAKLQKQLESHEECKCPQLKEELKQVKESVKSHRNHCNDEFIRKLHDLNDECNDLRRELSAEQTALKDEISQLEKDKELFKLENQWLKDKLDEMRIEMRKHFLLSSDDNKEPTDQHDHSQNHHHLQPGSKESRIISKRKKRKQGKEETDYNDDGKEEDDDDDDGDDDDLGDNDTIENETLESMRKTMVTVESLLRKLDDKISTLNLEDQKKLMEKIIVEIAKTQINLQVESMFKGIRSLLEDLHRQLISFQSTIDQQQSNNQVKQQTNDEDEMMKMKSSDDDKLSELDLDHDENHEHGGGGGKENKEKQLKDDSSNCSPTTKKIIANGFSVFESRISQLTSSIEKLEDNIERQELNMLIQARGSIWSTLTDPTGMVMDTGHYRRDVNNNSILINYVNRNEVNQLAQRKPQSIFVQSLMRLQSSKPIDGKSNYLKLINGNTNNYEPSFDFNYTKNNLSKQIDSLKSELGLSR